MAAELAILAEGVRKRFGDVVAVDGVSLAIPRGEIFGLVGPDGAGKTTMMRLLAALFPPDEGILRVAGHDIVRDPESVRPRLGYLSQRFSMYGELTVAENIAFFAEMFGVPRAARREREAELLQMTRLAPFRDRRAQDLSGGMKQKLALICTLIHRPEVILLDEPTTGVDPVSRREFWKLLADLPSAGITLLVSTPYLDEAERCHRLGFMAQGRLLAVDTPQALKQYAPAVIYRVRVEPLRVARDFLRGRPEVEGAELFGDRLHVSLREGDGKALAALLAGAGFTASPPERVAPSLEDAFVALTRAQEAAHA
ncbi:MAG TPA: ABC transporter ATP-binding protein [Armatimonadota bacterium]|nr:ABC transporter ATP-binding protein [Armatimonadota bacterium]HOM83579.1 ABC transporter ATP-binding protein [Armatimonadota bacterium]HPO73732.1 ABC transporter ATP-binding protein [Armatimonadota bacterium]HPT98081.1 ABC transporter ATP-binding protein [Armatimonadota bacterium]